MCGTGEKTCAICGNGDGDCQASMHDDYYYPASRAKVIYRLDYNKYPDDKQAMIDYLKKRYNYTYKEN
jgi:hypothetical protein